MVVKGSRGYGGEPLRGFWCFFFFEGDGCLTRDVLKGLSVA
jgi:hypothetical protein